MNVTTEEIVSSEPIPSIDKLQEDIVEDFLSIGDPFSQYEYLIEFAASLPHLSEELKTEDNLVKGCQSRAWLVMEACNGNISLKADSDTLIVRGILHLLINVLDGQALYAVANADLFFLEKADLMATFTASRRSGIESIVKAIRQFAKEHV